MITFELEHILSKSGTRNIFRGWSPFKSMFLWKIPLSVPSMSESSASQSSKDGRKRSSLRLFSEVLFFFSWGKKTPVSTCKIVASISPVPISFSVVFTSGVLGASIYFSWIYPKQGTVQVKTRIKKKSGNTTAFVVQIHQAASTAIESAFLNKLLSWWQRALMTSWP